MEEERRLQKGHEMFDKQGIVKFKIKSINDDRIVINSIADNGNIEFTIKGKEAGIETINSKFDIDMTWLKFIALNGPHDGRINIMQRFINNDEQADQLIECMKIHADPEKTDEEKKMSKRALTSAITVLYNSLNSADTTEESE